MQPAEKVLEKFNGWVVEDAGELVHVHLTDMANNRFMAELYRVKITEKEQKYIEKGAYFTWTIFEDLVTKKTRYEIVFNKEVWTQKDIDAMREEAKKFDVLFNIEEVPK